MPISGDDIKATIQVVVEEANAERQLFPRGRSQPAGYGDIIGQQFALFVDVQRAWFVGEVADDKS